MTCPINQSTPSEYERAFAELAKERADALLLGEAGEFFAHRKLIVELAEKARLPTIYAFREFITAGGLMAYAVDQLDLSRKMADQVHQILSGGNPADIPVQQATEFALLVNTKASRDQGFNFPPSLLARADDDIACRRHIPAARLTAIRTAPAHPVASDSGRGVDGA